MVPKEFQRPRATCCWNFNSSAGAKRKTFMCSAWLLSQDPGMTWNVGMETWDAAWEPCGRRYSNRTRGENLESIQHGKKAEELRRNEHMNADGSIRFFEGNTDEEQRNWIGNEFANTFYIIQAWDTGKHSSTSQTWNHNSRICSWFFLAFVAFIIYLADRWVPASPTNSSAVLLQTWAVWQPYPAEMLIYDGIC